MSSSSTPLKIPATEADLLAQPPDGPHYELIDGDLVEKQTSAEHSYGQIFLGSLLFTRYSHRAGKGDGPGGWWILPEAYVRFGAQVLRPDLCGWRRETMPTLPKERVIAQQPDWVCEIVSPEHAAHDLVRKRRLYHQHQVRSRLTAASSAA